MRTATHTPDPYRESSDPYDAASESGRGRLMGDMKDLRNLVFQRVQQFGGYVGLTQDGRVTLDDDSAVCSLPAHLINKGDTGR